MKLESDLSKLARWIIPGWIAILTFYVFVSTDIVFNTVESYKLFPTVNDFFKEMFDIEEALVVVLVAAAGVPIGFLIYQVYFFFRWNSPFSRDGLLSPLSQGRLQDLKASIRDLKIAEMSNGSDWRLKIMENPLFTRDHAFQWSYLEALFLEAVQKIDTKYSGFSTYSRHRYLHEVMHTLGASTFALYFGFAGYLALKYMKYESVILYHFVALVTFVGILFALLNQEEEAKASLGMNPSANNKPKDDDLENIHVNQGIIPTFSYPKSEDPSKYSLISFVSPGLVFIFTFALIHLFGNPALNPSLDTMNTIYRALFALITGAIWMLSRKNPSIDVAIGDFLSVSIALGIAFLFRWHYSFFSVKLDWAYLTVIFEFLILSLVMTKNRQNTKDELTFLEYYTLRRFLTDQDHVEKDNKIDIVHHSFE